MPVRIGNSYVSEAAVEFAKNSSEVENLSQKFPDLKISAGTQPFGGQGHGNLTIAPNILRQMQNDPEKRVEYEALIYDMQRTKLNRDKDCVASGWMINSDGSCGAWSISKHDDGTQTRQKSKIDRDRLAGRLPESEKKSKKKSSDIDENYSEGKITVGFNEGKRSRQLAAAKNLSDMNSLMQLLLEDLDEIQDGLEHGYCDENELKKVKKMIERAKKKLAEVQNQPNQSAEKNSDFSISVLF
ncbi:MAG: hypothetical protein IJ575_02815 [Selenomonadaceae bacterium]|nr:hypothetical protein [Selenomonadaceae bacterium]